MYFLLILSHKKSTYRDSQRTKILSQNNGKFIFYYFIGDTNLESDYLVDEPNNIVYLKVPDNYESLSLKTFHAVKFIHEKYPNIEGVFKTDDDIDLDLNKLFNLLNDNRSIKYFGTVAKSTEYNSDYHFGKCESPDMNSKYIRLVDCTYCAGGGYYLSNDIIPKILNSESVFREFIFEDFAMGLALNRCGIYPIDVDVKSNGSMWISNDNHTEITFQLPQNNNVDRCYCDEIKNKRMYNFCQKCNKLY